MHLFITFIYFLLYGLVFLKYKINFYNKKSALPALLIKLIYQI
ncbi:MAG: hypothetical protein HPY66_0376 [Firmicutes bacterium]|nr:hypothetical protein [Bacillota bacterium]